MAEVIIGVQGMTCGGCVAVVERTVSALTGVLRVKASLDDKLVKVEYDQDQIDAEAIRKRIEDAGYETQEA